MANDKNRLFKKIYFLWKGETEKRNKSIDWYCERYGADIEEFHKWPLLVYACGLSGSPFTE